MAKIVALADLHLSDWKSLGIDETGRSVFLRKVVTLAEEISKRATVFNADAIVIAGDVYDTAVLTPSVADTADEVVRILSKTIPLVLTPGQHDSNTKTPELFPWHTHLSRFKPYSNVVSAVEFTKVKYLGYIQSICVVPWNPNHVLPDDAEGDILVSHGAVQGCKNTEGYRFNSGFSQVELFKRFKLSIIGDIHNGQVFAEGDRKILIPGTPVQFNYKDSPTNGIWLCDIPEQGEVTCEFVSSESLCPNIFPKYLFTDDPEKKSSALVHYRYRPSKTSKPSPGKASEFKKDTSSIVELGLQIIRQAKIDNQDLISSIFPKLMESLPSLDRKVPRSRLHNVEIHNFLSIEDFALDFKEFPDNLIVTGKNGSGKSSLVEAIYWCLTGSNTKGILVNNVRNWYGDSGTFVSTILEVEDTMYKIGRGRTDIGPQLQIFMFTDRWVPYTGTKTAVTQDVIYELLGISEWEIKLLSYFPASNPSLFGSIGKSDRYSLLSTIVGMSTIDVARDKLGEMIKANGTEIVFVESRLRTLRDVRDAAKAKLSEYLTKKDNQVTANITDLERQKADIETQVKAYSPSSKLREKMGLSFNRSSAIAVEKADLETKITNLALLVDRVKKDIEGKKSALVSALEGSCPMCGQSLTNDTVSTNLMVEIEGLRAQLPDVSLEPSLRARLAEKDQEHHAIEDSLAILRAEVQTVESLETALQLVISNLAKAKEGQTDYEPLILAETDNYENYKTQVTQEEARLDTLKRLHDAQNWISKTLLKRNGLLMSELAKQGQKLLQDQVDILTEGETFKVTIEDDLSVSASFLGRKSGDYSQLSTGQARVVDIIMMVALNNLFTQLYHMENGVLGLVIFDEVLSFLDPMYSEYCFGLINRVSVPKRIVISHDINLISRFNNEISVSLEGESSSVITKNWAA